MTPEEAITNPAKLAFALGELTGKVELVISQRATEHQENQGTLESIRIELAQMSERSNISATVAREFSDFKHNEHVPLRDKVDTLDHWRIYLAGASALLGVLFTVTIALAKLWNVF